MAKSRAGILLSHVMYFNGFMNYFYSVENELSLKYCFMPIAYSTSVVGTV